MLATGFLASSCTTSKISGEKGLSYAAAQTAEAREWRLWDAALEIDDFMEKLRTYQHQLSGTVGSYTYPDLYDLDVADYGGIRKKDAFAKYKALADKGDAAALCAVAMAALGGVDGMSDEGLAADCWQKAAEQGFAPALYGLGWCTANGIGVAQDEEKAFDLFRQAADRGFVWAHQALAWCYEQGAGTAQDEERALGEYGALETAARGGLIQEWNGSLVLADSMAEEYRRNGDLSAKSQALRRYKEAAAHGDELAQERLADWYHPDTGLEPDAEECGRWERAHDAAVAAYRKQAEAQKAALLPYQLGLAEAGDRDAMLTVMLLYSGYADSLGNLEQYFFWLEKLAEAGNEEYALTLAEYRKAEGTGRGIDYYKRMLPRWKEAAAQGDTQAQEQLARAYSEGNGTATDLAEALRYFRLAADGGNREAQFELAECYRLGKGTEADEDKAIGWYITAARNGYPPAQDKVRRLGLPLEE